MKDRNLSVVYHIDSYRGLTTCDLDECGQPIANVHTLYVNGRQVGDFGYVCLEKVVSELRRDQRRLEERFS